MDILTFLLGLAVVLPIQFVLVSSFIWLRQLVNNADISAVVALFGRPASVYNRPINNYLGPTNDYQSAANQTVAAAATQHDDIEPTETIPVTPRTKNIILANANTQVGRLVAKSEPSFIRAMRAGVELAAELVDCAAEW